MTQTPAGRQREIVYLPLGAIRGAHINPKTHDGPGIARSISAFGLAELPLLDERTNRIVAGHGRIADLHERKATGAAAPPGIRVDDTGEWLVPVQAGWASADDAHARAYLAASNKLSANGGWDTDLLGPYLADLDAGGLLELSGFSDDELAALLGDDDTGDTGEPDDTDDDEALPADPVTEPGDLWILGRHRLLCGDATDPAHLDRLLAAMPAAPALVVTDPPYGISVVKHTNEIGGSRVFGSIGDRVGAKGSPTLPRGGAGRFIRTTRYAAVIGDNTTRTVVDAFRLITAQLPDAVHVWWGANHYAGDAGLPNARCWLVWDKENGASDFADAELAWTNHAGSVRMFRHQWNGMLRASERGGGQRVHPTQKPVALIDWVFDTVDRRKQRTVVLDAFAGSGPVLLAAEQSGRDCAAMELAPAYADVICRRWQKATGCLPVLEATGESHDFTAT